MKAHNRKLKMSDEELAKAYLNKTRTVAEIASDSGVGVQAVYWKLNQMGIKRRSNAESHKGLHAGDRNPNWRGGRRVKPSGYIVNRVSANTDEYEHRIVAEEKLGRPIKKGEVCHHINGDKADNRPENIEVFPSHSEHMKIHMTPEEARRRGKRGLDARYGRAALAAVEAAP